jgi:hypothetical protein
MNMAKTSFEIQAHVGNVLIFITSGLWSVQKNFQKYDGNIGGDSMFGLGKCWWCELLPSACEGCACSILRNAREGQEFLIMLKGTAEFLALGPGQGTQPTEFSFVRFKEESCCAIFTFSQQPGAVPAEREFIIDCRSIIALSPLPFPL